MILLLKLMKLLPTSLPSLHNCSLLRKMMIHSPLYNVTPTNILCLEWIVVILFPEDPADIFSAWSYSQWAFLKDMTICWLPHIDQNVDQFLCYMLILTFDQIILVLVEFIFSSICRVLLFVVIVFFVDLHEFLSAVHGFNPWYLNFE